MTLTIDQCFTGECAYTYCQCGGLRRPLERKPIDDDTVI